MEYYKSKRTIDKKPPLRWIIVNENGDIVNRYPSKEELKGLKTELRFFRDIKKPIYYNDTNTCDRCREEDRDTKLVPRKSYREHDKEGNLTGRWICINCFSKYDPNSRSNIIRLLRDRRIDNLRDPGNIFGDNILKLAQILYGWENLNEKYDNYNTPIDCYDPKTGLYHQVQGHNYNFERGFWNISHFENEWGKIYEYMVCFCFKEYTKFHGKR